MARRENAIAAVRDATRDRAKDSPYFPFSFYRPGELRAAQGYLTKFPAALVTAIPELNDQLSVHAEVSPATKAKGGREGLRRTSEPLLRKAIEVHAVKMAIEHYTSMGATEIIELGKPYDLLVRGLEPGHRVSDRGDLSVHVA
jgi:hypothetical protein